MLIYGHRGSTGKYLEGSKIAYEAAIAQGADGLECDLRLTKDKQIICYHDSDTKRLSGLDHKIANTTFSQLEEWVKPYKFDQLLNLAINHKKDLLIETKHPVPTKGLIEKVLHDLLKIKEVEIKKSGINISLISFSYRATLRNKKSGFDTGLLINKKFLAKINPAPIVAVSIGIIRRDQLFVINQQKRGKKVMAWTVNAEEDLNLCADLGLYAVITDNPEQARMLLGYS
jgi:glycerophosphoryl diester phosphodiesterase